MKKRAKYLDQKSSEGMSFFKCACALCWWNANGTGGQEGFVGCQLYKRVGCIHQRSVLLAGMVVCQL